MYDLIFSPETDGELLESYYWYEEQKYGLGEEFVKEVERTLGKIRNNPLHYAFLFGDVHQTLVDIFPFVISYQLDQKRRIISFCLFSTPAEIPNKSFGESLKHKKARYL